MKEKPCCVARSQPLLPRCSPAPAAAQSTKPLHVVMRSDLKNVALPVTVFRNVENKQDYLSGSGMNSGSPGTLAKRSSRQSALAFSMRSRVDDTKFHQM